MYLVKCQVFLCTQCKSNHINRLNYYFLEYFFLLSNCVLWTMLEKRGIHLEYRNSMNPKRGTFTIKEKTVGPYAEQVLNYQHGWCDVCGHSLNLAEVVTHHIINRHQGGPTVFGNLRARHMRCEHRAHQMHYHGNPYDLVNGQRDRLKKDMKNRIILRKLPRNDDFRFRQKGKKSFERSIAA